MSDTREEIPEYAKRAAEQIDAEFDHMRISDFDLYTLGKIVADATAELRAETTKLKLLAHDVFSVKRAGLSKELYRRAAHLGVGAVAAAKATP